MPSFIPKHVEFEQIYEDLNLPDGITVTKEEMIKYFDKLKAPNYPEIMYEHYVNGRGFTDIEREHPEFYRSRIYSCVACGIHSLRKIILEDQKHIRDRFLLDFVNGKDIHSHPVFDWKTTVGEAVDYLETYDYHRSVVTDRIVTQMQNQGIEIYYPKFLLKRPAYPYNLYAEFLTNFRPKGHMLVKDLYKLHVDNICMHPDRSFYALENNKDIIFSNKNMYFSEISKTIGYLYFQEHVDLDVIADSLEVSPYYVKTVMAKMKEKMRHERFTEFMFSA